MKKILLALLPLFLIMMSCEEDEETPKPENKLEANAGADQQVEVGTLVTLDGSASKDGNGETFDYEWTLKTQPDESEAELSDETVTKPTFTPDVAGDYVIELKISNESGSDTDEVTIKASATPTATATIIDGDITEEIVLENIFEDPAVPDYHVTAMVAVNAKLTIEPGVVIIFDEDKGLKINADGKLIAKGTETQLITFTGKEEEKGYWAGIMFLSSSLDNEMTYTEVKYAAGDAIYPFEHPTAIGVNDEAYLKLTHSSVEYAMDNGLFVKTHGIIDYEHNYFGNNEGLNVTIPVSQAHKMDANSRIEARTEELNYVQLMGTSLEEEEEVTWVSLSNGTVYKLVEEVSVGSGLRLEPGTHLRFNPNKFFRIFNEGYLYAKGTNTEPIIMDIAPAGGFKWGGLLIKSSSPDNLLEYVEIYNAGNGQPAYGLLKSAAVSVDSDYSTILNMKNTYIFGSLAYGLYVENGAVLGQFDNNLFEENAIPASLPIKEIGKLASTAIATSSDGEAAIEINGASLNIEQEASWVALEDGTPYFIPESVNVHSGLKLNPGVTLKFGLDAVLQISPGGYLNAVGTADAYITFTSINPGMSVYWKGILIQSNNSMNVLDYTQVSYGGSNDMPGMVSTKANIAVDAISPGKLIVTNSAISHGAGWGVAVETGWGATINDDVESSNVFDDLSQGNLYKY
ncbi:PKD domain-containing protein [Catalinimonas sp. 4WD22]|uniref:PKD domain-containing protein n=1 Tax=Catalinimonas locisalis TaxID=3133978 RepID=UPI00310152F8